MDLSHERKFTADMFFLYPTLVEDVLPGDKWHIGNEIVVRMMPMVAPIMHEINCYVHYFFVPKRIMWTKFERYYFRQPDGRFTATVPKIPPQPTSAPYTQISAYQPGGLLDYLYCYTHSLTAESPNANVPNSVLRSPDAWPLMAYNITWHHFYRDENQQAGLDTTAVSDNFDHPVDDDLNQFFVGSCRITQYNPETSTQGLHIRAWGKDYFTSSLPFQQKGTELGIPISGLNIGSTYWPMSAFSNSDTTNVMSLASDGSVMAAGSNHQTDLWRWFQKGRIDADPSVNSLAFSVTDLRWVTQVQRWQELLARGGSRYIEGLRSFFGVAPRDSRLDRPEYIGGSKTPIVVSEVLQTSATQDSQNPATSPNTNALSPQGTMAGHGISADRTFVASYSVQEPGIILGLMSFMPKTLYQQGLSRMWQRDSVMEEYWPQFQQLSEQPIKRSEIFNFYYNTDLPPDQQTPFGYIGRYDEYRFRPSSVHGKFRTDLKYWHMGRIFSSTPGLNENFIVPAALERQAMKRVLAVPTEPMFMVSLGNRCRVTRPMMWMAQPGRLDHN
jgi:hypothetical protein